MSKKCIAVNTQVFPNPEVFIPGYDPMQPGAKKISHMESHWAIIVREDVPVCPCCTQPLSNGINEVWR